jgi:hypothetical protein
MISSSQIHICDVCRLLDYDTTKKLCGYCGMCDAWICTEDQSKWGRRLLAAAKRKLEGDYKGLPNYEEVVQGGTKNESPANS